MQMLDSMIAMANLKKSLACQKALRTSVTIKKRIKRTLKRKLSNLKDNSDNSENEFSNDDISSHDELSSQMSKLVYN